VELDGQLYTVTIWPEGVHIAPKGKRKGHELSWRDLASGDAELNRDLIRSLTKPGKRGWAEASRAPGPHRTGVIPVTWHTALRVHGVDLR